MAMPLEMQKTALEQAAQMYPDNKDKQEGFVNGALYLFTMIERTIDRLFKEKKNAHHSV